MSLSELYAQHLQQLMASCDRILPEAGYDHLLVHAGELVNYFLDDQSVPFRPNPHFLHWLPLQDCAGSFIWYSPGNKPVFLYRDGDDFWHSRQAVKDAFWLDHFEFIRFAEKTELVRRLPSDRVALIAPEDPGLGGGQVKLNPAAVINPLHYARARKSEYEIACLAEANRIAARGHLAAIQAFTAGASELDVHYQYLKATRHTEQELPYENIIAINEHAAILHYQYKDASPPQQSLSLLVDAGARNHGYAADITRTTPALDGNFADLCKAMDKLQRDIVDLCVPGADYVDLHIKTHEKLAILMLETGLATGNADTLVDCGITRALFPHGLGHLLGLQVHDVGGWQINEDGGVRSPPEDHPFLRLTRTLEEDHVFTIEPGLYFIPMLLEKISRRELLNWKLIDELMPWGGIRIEDNVVVTSSGPRNLSREAFAQLKPGN